MSKRQVNPKLFIAVMSIEGLLCGWLLNKNHYHLPLGIERDLTILFFFGSAILYAAIAYLFGRFDRISGILLLVILCVYMILQIIPWKC